jgi:hypothetical protein
MQDSTQQDVFGPSEGRCAMLSQCTGVADGDRTDPHEQHTKEQGTDDIELCVPTSSVRAAPSIGQPKSAGAPPSEVPDFGLS